MESKYKIWSLFALFCIVQATHAQLECYVCENCPDPTMVEIPVVNCDEEYFTPAPPDTSTTEPTTNGSTDQTPPITITTDSSTMTDSTSTMTTEGITTEETTISTTEEVTSTTMSTTTTSSTTTTTEPPTTTTTELTTESSTTTEESTTEPTTESTTPTTTTTSSTTSSTTTTTTEIPTTTEQPKEPTEALPPTPTTYFPATSVPTPPNTGTVRPILDAQNQNVTLDEMTPSDSAATDSLQEKLANKTYITSAAFRHRQLRAAPEYTFHCYKVLASVNGTMVTNRGCSRVKTMESVCGKYKDDHPMQNLSKCYPCSNSRCNGSTALSVSISALVLALVALVLQRQ